MNNSKWLKWLVWGGAALLAVGFLFTLIAPAMGGGAWGYGHDNCGWWGGWDTMTGYGRLGYRPLGWLGMLFGLFIRLGMLALVVAGGIWLVNALTTGGIDLSTIRQNAQTRTDAAVCPACGKPVQPDWNTCPYCGTALND